ncbi:hypothetical protein EQG49_00650 [Periweissella cryptocerci]|uniref:Uncharacterized protein n=1 Tax=Periweissella cryptocerci TaxID=2506420 RepID=A0A4P6YR42_9LACO|nr:hypothetical protein [Periweissella cryptocerci]QBO35063.1 hypothetical protein EQG49_00650 [Periweissella cryptocerci]
MNRRQFSNLFKINLIYANPQLTTKAREKGKYGRKLIKYLLSQMMFTSVALLIAYVFMMLPINFSQHPGLFTFYLALYTLLGFSQSISAVQNVFFEAHDLEAYLPLPISQRTIFTAKLAVVVSAMMAYLLPSLPLFILTAMRANYTVILGIPLALVIFMLFMADLLVFSTLLVFGLTQTKVFQRFKKSLTTILLAAPMILVVGGIVLINRTTSGEGDDPAVIGPFIPLQWVLVHPLMLKSLLTLLVMLVFLGGAGWIIIKSIIPKLYDTETKPMTSAKTKLPRAGHQGDSLTKQLVRYNFSLIKNPSLLMQVISQTILLPMIMVISITTTSALNFHQLSYTYFGVCFVVGIVFSLMSANQGSLAANIISLDRDNYAYFLALPISQSKYLKLKFNFSFAIQIVVTAIVLTATAIFLKLPIFLIGMLIVGAIVGALLGSSYYFARDYRLRNLTWTNVSQLFSRGGSTKTMLILMAEVFGGGILITLYAIPVALKVINLPINVAIFAAILVGAFIVYRHYQKHFWQQFVD